MSPLPGRFKVRIPLFRAAFGAAIAVTQVAIPAAPQAKVSTTPSGSIPRTADGKPDLSGLWDHPFVIDMSKDGRNDACGAEVKGCSQKAEGPLPMTPWAADWSKNYDPGHYDATAHCNPMGDTLVVDTAGPFFATPKMLLDTAGHPVSEDLHVVERFRRIDATHLSYEVTVSDPKMYTKPFTNVRTWVLMPKSEEILEYVCTENNKEVDEHHIK